VIHSVSQHFNSDNYTALPFLQILEHFDLRSPLSIMDQVKTKQAQPQKPTNKPLSMVEAYQRQWDQLMEDTNRQIDKIRRKSTQSARG
jgi:hypothetical protein